jgi:hypothetical protein
MSIVDFTKKKPAEAGSLSFCYEVFLTLGSLYQAANANCESFAITLISSFYIVADVLSTLLLFALSKPWQAHQKHTI